MSNIMEGPRSSIGLCWSAKYLRVKEHQVQIEIINVVPLWRAKEHQVHENGFGFACQKSLEHRLQTSSRLTMVSYDHEFIEVDPRILWKMS